MSLIEKGWLLKKGVIYPEQISQLFNELQINSEDQTKKIIVINKNFYKHPHIRTLSETLLHEANKFENYKGLKLSKIWFVNSSFENSKPGELPYVLHFDRRRFLKIMLYLTDVGEHDGPFTVSDFHVEKLVKQRKNIKRFSKDLMENTNIEKIDYKPINANAGDCVIFDTNCPHFAAPVGKSRNRKVIRLDFERNDWNKHLNSLARNLFQSLIN